MENVELVSITPNAMELLKRVAGVCYQVPPSEKVVKKIVKLGRELNFDVSRVDWPRKRSANAGGQS